MLLDQIRRSAKSVMFNFAEGIGKGGNRVLIQHLFHARGSCYEVRPQLDVALDQAYISGKEYADVDAKCGYIISMIGNFVKYLKKTKYKGHKFID